MKAIQSVAHALTGVNIFAKATASSMKNVAGSSKQANKSLAGVHSEINNISDNDGDSASGSVGPSFDLSKMDSTPNSIIEAIKNGNWYQVGESIGQKLNEAMESIPWKKIQNTAKKIGSGIANFLNGFIKKTNWLKVGNTFAQGLNTIIYFAYEFVTNFEWKKFGTAIGDAVNGFIKNIDWAKAGQTISNGIKGIIDSINSFIQKVDWLDLGEKIKEFIVNIDWTGIVESLCSALGSALAGLGLFLVGLFGEAWENVKSYFNEWIENSKEQGGNVVDGILAGIGNALKNIGNWIYEHMIKPIVDAFCNMLGIHSPSTVFMEFGKFIVQGLLNGIGSLIGEISKIWDTIVQNVGQRC